MGLLPDANHVHLIAVPEARKEVWCFLNYEFFKKYADQNRSWLVGKDKKNPLKWFTLDQGE